MAVHTETKRVLHAPGDVFDLVADVRDYPAFIRWIRAMRVFDERVENGVGELTAEAVVGFKFVRERFSTKVVLNKPENRIEVSFIDGPFAALENRWRFTPLADGSTLIDFWIDYRFRNRVLQALLAANFARAADTLINAFDRRAGERCPPAGDPKADVRALLASV